ncbi:hypothetical protein KSS87_019679 [Heliosperma pusillum]|nr:hypothetical protein KSS87_019679 [Heliosperma pusillum]
MASLCSVPVAAFVTTVFMALLLLALHPTEAQIGVCYGMNGNNLPSEQQVVNLYKSNGIGFMRIYGPDQAALKALQGSGIKLFLDVPNEQLQTLAHNPSQASQWVQNNVVPFASSIRYIAVGNEVQDSDKPFVLPAMQNVQNALINSANLGGQIKVSTAIYSAFIANSFPPSTSVFNDISFMGPIVNFLNSHGSPLLANIYPYFSYIDDEKDIQLSYALFTSPGTVVMDPYNRLPYQNLFDALVDAVYAALAKAGGPNIRIVVSESGWPSVGGDSATASNAATYYRNLINHVKNGTPRKPGQIETYLFAMFDENQKTGAATEQHFGLFTPAAFVTTVFMALLLFALHPAEAQIGVCYGMNGNNLPSEQQVVNLYKSNGIRFMRIYGPDQAALKALQGSGIKLLLDVPNDQLKNLANNPSQASQWVQNNVVPFASSIRYIAVGNEVQNPDKPFVLPAMQNVQNALNSVNLGSQIKVSTAIYSAFIANSFPPSNGVFNDISFMGPIVNFLNTHGSPLLANIYPYFSYIGDETHNPLSYALFTFPGTMVIDGNNGLKYQNLFDALVDAVYAALAKANGPTIPIVVSESGWPSVGGDGATASNAATYYRNLINHVKNGTPRRPVQIETYLFAMFDENLKTGASTEQNFGLFTPGQQSKYGPLSFGS